MAPGNFAKKIKILGGPSVRGAQATLGGVPHPSQIRSTKIIKAAPDAGGSSIISRRRNPIRFGETSTF